MNHSTDPNLQGSIVCLGSINADFQVRIDRWPEVSETLVASEFRRLGGGKAANTAFLARTLGWTAVVIGRVGDDDLAEQALDPLRRHGVDVSHVRKVAGESTGFSMITVPPNGKKGIVLASNANDAWSAADVAETGRLIACMDADCVLIVDCEVTVEAAETAARVARERGALVILDPSPGDRVTNELLASADFIVPNPAEAEQLTGIACTDAASASRAGRHLLDRGVGVACVKLPDGGCVLVEKDKTVHIGTVDVDVVDTTGAGDAFAGALAVALMDGLAGADAARFAAAASHLAVTRYGSQPSYPQRAEIERMMQRLKDNIVKDEATRDV